MVESKPESPLGRKVVPARGAAQKAAANLKQQQKRRPEASSLLYKQPSSVNVDEGLNTGNKAGTTRQGKGAGGGWNSGSESSPLSSPPGFSTPQKRLQAWTASTPSKRAKMGSTSLSQDKRPYNNGDVVWVLLHSESDGVDERMSYWWPAQVTCDTISPLDVKLFGDDGYGAGRIVSITSPTPSTVLPFRDEDEGRIRFSPANFASMPSDPFDKEAHLVSRWRTALDNALTNDGNDELPDPLELLDLTMSAGKKKKELTSSDAPLTPSPSRSQRPPPAPLDQAIKVGEEDGELVLARDHKDRPDHWPAQVLGVSQNKRTGNWLYEVRFIDGKRKKIDRKWFFSTEDEGFSTCQMGEWRTEFPASDTEGIDSEEEFWNRDAARPDSPSPSDSDLEDITDFGELSLPDQMRYVYPFLCRIIRREYQPSFERHDAFMKGGKAREKLTQTASLRGEFSENEMKKVSALTRKAMLRNERWAERIYDDGEEKTTVPTSDEAKGLLIDDATESSPYLDAATTLTELESKELNPLRPTGSVPQEDSMTTIMTAKSPTPPPSSFVSTSLSQSSDTDLALNDHESRSTPTTFPDRMSKEELPSQSERRSRPKGCEAYENLPRSERLLYCSDVLLPEAVLQLHVFRAGHRTSAHMLTPEQETRLYKEGQELLQTEVHWVTQIVQLRQMAQRARKSNDKKDTSSDALVLGGTSTRPKMIKSKDQ